MSGSKYSTAGFLRTGAVDNNGKNLKDYDMISLKKKIPRVSPKAYEYVKQVLDFGFRNAHSVGITGRLEHDFARRFGQAYGIAHCNGTATMQSGLLAAGVGVGDEVIVPAFTVFSTPAVVLQCNAVLHVFL